MQRATLGLLCWLLFTGAAPGKIERLAILPIVLAGPHGHASLSSVIDDVSRAARFRLGVRLLSDEEMFVASAEVGQRVQSCGADVSCIADRLRAFDARFGLVVVVNFAIEPPLVGLQLLDTDERRLVGQELGQLAVGERDVSAAIRERAARLLDQAGYGQAGRVVVKVQPPQAKLSLADFPADPGSPNVFTVPPGSHLLKADADGFVSAETQVVVTAGQTLEAGLVLEEQRSIFSSPWLWIGVGAAVAGGTTAAVLASRPGSRCVCVYFAGQGCAGCPD